MIVASVLAQAGIVPCRINSPRSSSIASISANSALVKSWRSSQWRNFNSVVASGTGSWFRSIPAKPRNAWLSYSASSSASLPPRRSV
jgi:hypothetical protein